LFQPKFVNSATTTTVSRNLWRLFFQTPY